MSSSASQSGPVRWSVAMDRALYGPGGFYTAGEGAAGHFRTSATVGDVFAGAIARLLDRVDTALGQPDPLDYIEVGAGSSDLMEAVLAALGPGLHSRVRPSVVERRPRPSALPGQVRWLDAVPEVTGLLIANEWLDNVAVDVVVDDSDAGGAVLVVDSSGTESPGAVPTPQESAWLARWWPTGGRRELGLSRDDAWAGAMSSVRRGLAVAIDYTHTAAERPEYGTLTGFRRGRETAPIPDGSCDITAHVSIDSVAAAGAVAAGATGRVVRSVLTDQRTALKSLGVSGRRPEHAADPSGYATALQRASEAAELIDPVGLGAFSWLLQGIDVDPSTVLSRLP